MAVSEPMCSLGAPTDLFAALGFIAVFAGASNTPLACTIMGIELFGSTHTIYIAVVSFLAYFCSGHSGIYLSQRVGVPKTGPGFISPDVSLRDVRAIGRSGAVIDLFDRVKRTKPAGRPSIDSNKDLGMPVPHILTASDVGMVRIYLKPRDKMPSKGARTLWSSRPLYRELVLE